MKANSKDELIAYIVGLSSEQIDKIVSKLPYLINILNIQESGGEVG